MSIDPELLDYIENDGAQEQAPEPTQKPAEPFIETYEPQVFEPSLQNMDTFCSIPEEPERQIGMFGRVSNTILGILSDIYNLELGTDLFTKDERLTGIIYIIIMYFVFKMSND